MNYPVVIAKLIESATPPYPSQCVVTRYDYDSISRLMDVLHKAGDTTVIDGASYAYDNAGNRVSKTNYLDNSSEQYVYDDIYQLQQVTRNNTVSEAYTYDKVGNRLSSLGAPTYSYNSSNQLTSSSDGVTYTYDDNGNTLTKADGAGLTQYGWDYENRLTSVTLPGEVCHKAEARCDLKIVHEYKRDARFPEWHGWHAARRGLGSNLYRLGVPDMVIQRILRHANVSTTATYYIKTAADDVRNAMAKLEHNIPSEKHSEMSRDTFGTVNFESREVPASVN